MHGGRVMTVGRFFPSSKLCRQCGFRLEDLPLAIRTHQCPARSHAEDRDLNAARNILREGLRLAKTTDGLASGIPLAPRRIGKAASGQPLMGRSPTGGPPGSNACGQGVSTKQHSRFASRLNEAGRAKACGDGMSHPVKHQEKAADVG